MKKTVVIETIPAIGQYLSELSVGDWFHIQPTNKEAANGLRTRTLCVLVSTNEYRSYHHDALVFIPKLGVAIEMKEGRAVEHVKGVRIDAVDYRPADPARRVRESEGLTEGGRLKDTAS